MAPVTKSDVINRFNALVRDNLSPAAGTATWYYGNVPGSPSPLITNHADLGSQSEPAKTTGDLPGSAMMASTIFNVLHGLAMEFTRIRQARFIYFSGPATASASGFASAALKPNFALYFPIPGGQREPGEPIDALELDSFLHDLRNEVNLRRTSSDYAHMFANVCHSSCHSSCHGSRGRR